MTSEPFEIFLVSIPGLETVVADEARVLGFPNPEVVAGGVRFLGHWKDVWRANLSLRCPSRVLARIGSFPVFHLAQLDKRARKFAWSAVLRSNVPIKVEVSCKRSKIYHAGAAAQRIERAIVESFGAPVSKAADLRLSVRIEDNFCTLSVDTSGEPLHRRGHKLSTGKAPLRETLAAAFLRQCNFNGEEPVLDPMCGSGTFVIEAAERARGLQPGRSRSFAFENLTSFDATAWENMRSSSISRDVGRHFFGSDRDAGAIKMATENAGRANVSAITGFNKHVISDVLPPTTQPGLIVINPPYGGRIGNRKLLYALYGSLGKTILNQFSGWRVGLVTSEPGLAMATELPFLQAKKPIQHGGLKIQLWRTEPLNL
ncbi:MAG: class I SAM-dependent RNA methyltransferase [Pseudomonadota bacterium]